MKSRVTHTSYVIDFLDEGFDSDEISELLEVEVDELLKELDVRGLEDWEVVFNALYTKKDAVLLYRKTRSYVKDKYKEIVVHIPIPVNSEVDWGVNPDQHIELGNNPNTEKRVDRIQINSGQFDNRRSYILSCMRKAIRTSFELGFTVNKIKLRIDSKQIDIKG